MAFGALMLAGLCLGAHAVIFEGGAPFREEVVCAMTGTARLDGVCRAPRGSGGSRLPTCGLPGATASALRCSAQHDPATVPGPAPAPAGPRGMAPSRRACLQPVVKRICDNFQPPAAGPEVRPGDFPYFAGLGYKLKSGNGKISWLCGGALISENFVLTTANCARGSPSYGGPVRVRLGGVSFRENTAVGADEQELNVAQIIAHPAYNASSGHNDIALLRLAGKARPSRTVQPACLFPEERLPVDRAVVAGAGLSSIDKWEFGTLRKVDIPLVQFEKCREMMKLLNRSIDSLTMLCAGEKGRDTCIGDSGAPIVVKEGLPTCNYQIVGITSFGFRMCGSKPAIYVKVQAFLPWIEENVWGRN